MNNCSNEASNPVNMEKQSKVDKILGMIWNKQEDVFEFKTQFFGLNEDVLHCKRVPSKRELLKIAMSVFDPFGLLADFLLYSKVLMQDVGKKILHGMIQFPNVYTRNSMPGGRNLKKSKTLSFVDVCLQTSSMLPIFSFTFSLMQAKTPLPQCAT